MHRLERASGIAMSELASRREGPDLMAWRILVTNLAVGRFGHRVCDVAKLLQKNPGTVSRWLTEADRRSSRDAAYRRRLAQLDRAITAEGPPKVIK
jgi:hypothetical protein